MLSLLLLATLKCVCVVFLIIFAFFVCLRLWVEPFKEKCKCKSKLHGKVALITGGNSGIGFETAKDLAKRGATVIIASRDDNKSEEAVATIKEATGNDNVEYRHLNLANLVSIRDFAQNFNKEFHRLDILVNNAGCGKTNQLNTEYGLDMLVQTNYVGPFLLTYMLLDKLKISKPSRIVVVSSYLHKHVTKFDPKEIRNPRPRNDFMRYANTKLCNLLWTKELAKRLPQGVTINALHPGLVMTNIFNNFAPYLKYLLFFIIHLLFKTAEEGAQTIIHLCVCPNLTDSTGGYYQNCKKIKPAKHAEDSDLARRLWNETMPIIAEIVTTTDQETSYSNN